MSVQKWRFMETLTNALITPVYNSLLVAGDAAADYFGKLQGLLSVRKLRTVLTANVTGGASTTADFNLITFTIPAGQQLPGDCYRFEIRGTWDHPNSGGSTISFWVKFGNTKIATVTITPGKAVTSQPFHFKGLIVCQSVGAAGTVAVGCAARINTTATASIDADATPAVGTVNNAGSYNIVLGANFSNSNASNLVTAIVGEIYQN